MEKRKILLLDDDINKYDLTVAYLEIVKNYTVEKVRTFESALSAYNKTKDELCVILLDVMLPMESILSETERQNSNKGLNTGIVFAERINNEGNTVPIILLTARKDNDVESFVGQFHIKEILRKPIFIDDLTNKIESVCIND